MTPDLIARLRAAVRPERLLDTAVQLIEVPSPTRSGRDVADRLAKILSADGFAVERPVANWPQAPAVAARLDSGRPGGTLQFNGHLDTVHLPFVPPRVAGGVLYGSGASDMKGGLAAACEAMRALRDAGALGAGSVLITAHDLHEFPWGDGAQIDGLIAAGYVGDAVLLPEYHSSSLPLVGRGLAVLEVSIRRDGATVHEVLGGMEKPSVIAAGAKLVRRFAELDVRFREMAHPLAGRASLFVGQVHAGEIFNQAPVEFRLSGTRRWLPGTNIDEVEAEFHAIVAQVASAAGTYAEARFIRVRDAFQLDPGQPIVEAFQSAHAAATGRRLFVGAKPFVDDGNTFMAAGVPAITHGPDAKGAHTLDEAVPVAELVRVALVYALTAVEFC
ncbi:MAG TPA: M20/M25/M40 family metallo-hydrolase [Pirellulales bacterium]|jgi:acetylornithine deacetylase/succinyl-diaminopimelate desuccinylase-like protein|nr:M20/M25/M40 family metallo-hydrolase [Pirellulales bacterium]